MMGRELGGPVDESDIQRRVVGFAILKIAIILNRAI
jgi:hypothetical protein